MGLFLAAIVSLFTIAIALFIAFANGMSDAPGSPGVPIWPLLAVGFGIAAALTFTHFHHFHW